MISNSQVKQFQVAIIGESLPLKLIAQVEGFKKMETFLNEEGQIEHTLRHWIKLLDSPSGFQKFIYFNGLSENPRPLIEVCSFRMLVIELFLEFRAKRIGQLN